MNETNEFKSKALMFIMLYISAFVLLYFINANQDDIIVYTSFATYRTSLYLIYALLAVNTLFAFMTLISYFSHRFDEIGQSEKEIEESKNPLS